MANNINIKDASNNTIIVKTIVDVNGVHIPYQNVNLIHDQDGIDAGAGNVSAATPRVTLANNDPLVSRFTISSNTTTAVSVAGAGLTTVATITNDRYKLLSFHFDVTTQNLDSFKVFVAGHASAQLQDFTPSSWSTLPSGGVFKRTNVSNSTGSSISGDLNNVLATQNGYFEMEIDGLVSIVIKASAVADSSSVTPYWSLQS